MKLMLVVPNLSLGGAQRVAIALAEEWARQGHDVVAVTFDASNDHYATSLRLLSLESPVRAGRLRKGVALLGRALRLAELIRLERPDRLVSFMESANFPSLLAGALTGRLADVTVSVRNNPASLPTLFQWILPVAYRLAGRVVAVSAGVGEALVGLGVPRERLVTILNPLDLERVEAGAQEAIPAELIVAGRYVLAVGRLERQKGFDLLLDAFAALDDREVDLVILGEGAERGALEAQTAALGLTGRVHMPGKVANPFNVMARAECLVLTSRHEGWGNVLAEAMGAGCPVVAFDCPYGPRELVGAAGLLVPALDVPALATTLDRVLADGALRATLREAGRRRARAFALPATAQQWLAAAPHASPRPRKKPSLIHRLLIRMPDAAALRLLYWWHGRRPLNLKAPRSFSEKLQARKLGPRDPRLIRLSDKIRVKDVIAETLGEDWVIPTLWSGRTLPSVPAWDRPVIVKASHGSGWWEVYRPGDTHWQALVERAHGWLSETYGVHIREWHYAAIEPGLLIEPLLGDTGECAVDFKFMVVHGRAEYVQVVTRDESTGVIRTALFNRDWERLMLLAATEWTDHEIARPATLEQMLEAAERLASGFDFVRVDLYDVGTHPKFGEMTFYPRSGFPQPNQREFDERMGALWEPFRP